MNEFKIGDWVRTKSNNCFKIKSIDSVCYDSKHPKAYTFILFGTGRWDYSNDQEECYQKNECEFWFPKEGEWCWSKKRNELTNNVCELIRFYWDNTNIGDCEPFIGELPTFLKDK